MRTAAHSNLLAEARAIEEGHHARFDAEHRRFLVKSDNGPRTYELTARGVGGRLVVSCTCPAGVRRSVPAGSVACKHQARVARRFEREGLVQWVNGIWRITPKAESLTSVDALRSRALEVAS